MTVVEHEGRTFGLGALHRAFDIRELPYRLVPPTAVDLSKPYSLAQWRTRVEDQGSIGSCVSNAVTSSAELLARSGGATPEQLDRLWLYYESRVKAGIFPGSGSFPADACDFAMVGVPAESSEPLGYVQDETYVPPASVSDAPKYDYVQGHQPFYQTDPQGFVGGICHALDSGKPVIIALGWRSEFFNPPAGVLPVLPNTSIIGGHCVYAWSYTPDQGGLVWCRNSWSAEWTRPVLAAMQALNSEAEAGDFAIPAGLFANGVVWECRAVSGEPVTPQPTPPTPPNPEPVPPTPPTPNDKWLRALQAGPNVAEAFTQFYAGHPRSQLARGKKLGADAVVAAVAGE